MIIANVHEAKTNLSKLINEVMAGKNVIISKAGKPVVRLVQLKNKKIIDSYGKFKGKIWMSEDFNDEDTEINKMFYGEDE